MKKLFILLLLPLFLLAEKISPEQAADFATNFMKNRLNLAVEITETKVNTFGDENLIYLFNFSPKGYAVISGDDAALPVIGFSIENNLNLKQLNPNFSGYLKNYEKEIRAIKENKLDNQATLPYWQKGEMPLGKISEEIIIGPLMETKWGQEYPYNKYCPADENSPTGYGGHVPAGCVAIATAQIMAYWDYPTKGIGEHQYYHNTYGTQYANFDTTYHWQLMKDKILTTDPDSVQNAAAQLIYDLGVAVNMNYTAEGSGAYSYVVAEVLADFFQYSDSIQFRHKQFFSEAEWTADLYNEIVNQRPVYYAGIQEGEQAGHAFVFHGYWQIDGQEFFNVNWGWSGSEDGWFLAGALNTSAGNFNDSQRAAIFIEPAVATARFTADPTVGLEPLTVSFSDRSKGAIEAWQWEFGDGSISTLQNPVHTYETPGYYDVKLTVTDTAGFVSETKVERDMIFVKAKDELYGLVEGHRVLDDDTVRVLGDVTIASESVLEIKPGVSVLFAGNYEIINYGRLLANGTADSSVIFTALDTTGFFDSEKKAGGWKGFSGQATTNPDNLISLNHCKISHVKSQYVISAINRITVALNSVEITDNQAATLFNVASQITGQKVLIKNTILNSQVPDNAALINNYNGTIRFVNSIIADNEVREPGILYCLNGETEIINSTVYNNEFFPKSSFALNLDGNAKVSIINSILWNRCQEEFHGEDLNQLTVRNSNIKTDLYRQIVTAEKWVETITEYPQINDSDYTLYPWSPCIDGGVVDTAGLALAATDFFENQRFQGKIDMGAIEFHGEAVKYDIDFLLSDTLGKNPLEITFEDTTNFLQKNWDFDNDGIMDFFDSDTAWTFVLPGLYTVRLIAEIDGNFPVIKSKYVRILNSPPELLRMPDTLKGDEDEFNHSVDLKTLFSDPTNDLLIYTGTAENIDCLIADSIIIMKAKENYFGTGMINLRASDEYDSSATVMIPYRIFPVNDSPEVGGLPDSLLLTVNEADSLLLRDYITDVDDEFNELNIEISQSELVDAAIHYSGENRIFSIYAKNMVGRDTLTLMVADGEDSTFHKLSIKVDAETGVKKGMFSAEYRLNQNYPNPFNPATTISFSLAENARVNLTVYNLRGQRIFSLISGEIIAGRHEVIWKGRDFQGNAVPAGIYFYRLETENFTAMKKMLFIK